MVVDAVAEDGVVEGIEDRRRRFCLGVQWHPEFLISEADRSIFRRFAEAAGAVKGAAESDAGPQRIAPASESQKCWRAPGSARAATPSAGSPRAASWSTARY